MTTLADLTDDQISALCDRARAVAMAVLSAAAVAPPDSAVVSNPATRNETTVRDYNRDHAHFMRDRRRRQAAEEIIYGGTPTEHEVLSALIDSKDDATTFEMLLDARCAPHERAEHARRTGR